MNRKDQINQAYGMKCAAIGDITYKIKLLQGDLDNLLKDLKAMDDELREIIQSEQGDKHGKN